MRVEDLSIGDWVQDGNGIIAKVKGIDNWSDGYILNVQTVSGSIGNLTSTRALSIPLTPKILEKNGFEKVDSQWYMCELNGIHISVIVWGNQRGRIEISYKSPFDDDNPLYIADFTANIPHISVHHLQRVLRLAGVEKEIEL